VKGKWFINNLKLENYRLTNSEEFYFIREVTVLVNTPNGGEARGQAIKGRGRRLSNP